MGEPAFQQWIPVAKQVVRRTLGLRWRDVLEIYSYIPTIPIAEALALEARRAGSDTHITLMTDDLWFTSMKELTAQWLRTPSPVESAINGVITANVYLGGPADARRMRDIPPEKFEANSIGGARQGEPRRARRGGGGGPLIRPGGPRTGGGVWLGVNPGGGAIRGWCLGVRGGRIRASGAEETDELLSGALGDSKASKARIGWFSIGLTPAAEPCMLDNSIVRDDVCLGLGAHPQLERRLADPAVSFGESIGRSTIEIR